MESLLEKLNPQQRLAVTHTEGPMLVLAGAGSGKTRVLTYKIAYLIAEKKVNPTQILAVTFTNKAGKEMRERIINLLTSYQSLGNRYQLPWVGTFHSFCAWVLRLDGFNIGLSRDFVILAESEQREVIKQVLKKLNISAQRFPPGAILASISQAKNELITPDDYATLAGSNWQATVKRAYPAYQQELEKLKAVDFDDLLAKAVLLFQREPQVLAKYQSRFNYVLIDEYQDTNLAQYHLTKLLVQQHQNICVVGDCSQSIYGWRGADYRNVLHFGQAYSRVKLYELEQNYRSTQTILNTAHAIIKHNDSHPVLKLWTKKEVGESIVVYEAINEKDEADYVIRTLLQLQRSQPELRATDFAVLYRTNAQSRVIEEIFLRYDIPYLLVGGVRFYERKEIKDILAYLRLVVNPSDTLALERAHKVGKLRLKRLLECLQLNTGMREKITLEILDEVLQVTAYLELLDAEQEEGRARRENIQELRSVAAEYTDLSVFLENVALVEMEAAAINQKNELIRANKQEAVSLMTLHQAKGLEFDTVFILGMEEGLFPHSRCLADNYELEEERRLCYVGVTRARQRLYLSYARRRLFFGTWTANPVSRFVSEIPAELVSWRSAEFDT